ncbi:MAG: DUF423 domain-containing protein [Oligoflexia bacterium]|nr:DUF423 domain-containing protein [Oligoflexia bacterium]
MPKTTTPNKNKAALACFLLFLAVAIGAFGAHGLKGKVSDLAMETFKTGSLYHFFHATGLLILSQIKEINIKKEYIFMLIGIILFSFNCYLYAITGVKQFAMIVPIGGFSFLIAWLMLCFKFFFQSPGKIS